MTIESISKGVQSVSKYVLAHERLILGCIAAVVLYFGVLKIESMVAAHDKAVATVSEAAAAAARIDAAQRAAVTAQEQAKRDALEAEMQRQNAALVAANVRLETALTKQQAVDKTLPPPALAQRIETLAALPPSSVTPAPGNTFSVTNDGAVGIAVTLEKTNTLAQQLTNVSTEKSNDEKIIAEDKVLASNLKSQIDGLNILNAKDAKACTDEKKTLKAEARKGKLKWFGAGYVAGLATRGVIAFLAGH
jgi:hypothetical protein